jgi:hypothetical protein
MKQKCFYFISFMFINHLTPWLDGYGERGVCFKRMSGDGRWIDGISVVSVLWPDGHFRFQLMKRKQKSSQNKPSSGRFDAPRTRFQQAGTR